MPTLEGVGKSKKPAPRKVIGRIAELQAINQNLEKRFQQQLEDGKRKEDQLRVDATRERKNAEQERKNTERERENAERERENAEQRHLELTNLLKDQKEDNKKLMDALLKQ